MNILSKIVYRGWIFVSVFLLINWIFLSVYPKHFSQRFFQKQTFKSKKQFYSSVIYSLLLNMTMLFAVFVPLSHNIHLITAGVTVFIISALLYIIALKDYASTPPDQPVVKGIYRFSRHPQQILAEFMFIGCGLAASSWIIIVSCIAQLILLNQSMISQESYCIDKYGKPYEDYIKRTPRYFLIR